MQSEKALKRKAVTALADSSKQKIICVCARNSESRLPTQNLRATAIADFITKRNKEVDLMAEITLTSENFEKEVLKSEKPVLVDFWAVWCGPCQMLAPTVAEIAEEYSDKVKVGKVNVDDEMELAQSFGIQSIPTLILFKDGKAQKTSIGLVSKQEILDLID